MIYDEIMQCEDFKEKSNLLRDYYIEIGCLDWMKTDLKEQVINFVNRTEYRLDDKLHNINGPAIKFKNGGEFFYIYGKLYEKADWKKEATKLNRKFKLKRTLD